MPPPKIVSTLELPAVKENGVRFGGVGMAEIYVRHCEHCDLYLQAKCFGKFDVVVAGANLVVYLW